jgi:hypothetical protein
MNWEYMIKGDDDNLYFEDGTCRLLTASDYHLTFGKYSGQTLDEVSDEWYLGFLKKIAAEKGDWFLSRCLALKK